MMDTTHYFNHQDWEAIVGDEKQSDFFPRFKVKKWQNEVNLSLGLKNIKGKHVLNGDKVTFQSEKITAHFYPIQTNNSFNKKFIRYVQPGNRNATTMAAQFEMLRHVFLESQTIVSYAPTDPAMMYFGFYKTSDYIDKIDIPECRLAGYMNWNPFYMDKGLKGIEIYYNSDRDDIPKIDRALKQAVKDVLGKYVTISKEKGGKLYFRHQGRDVKFYSGGYFEGVYLTYINLDCNYNKVYDYYKKSIKKNINDKHAYGLKKANPKIPNNIVDKIIKRYSEIYGLPLKKDSFKKNEKDLITYLKPIVSQKSWIKNGVRSKFPPISEQVTQSGFEFEIHLSAKPDSNVIPFSVQSKELDFCYQSGEREDDTVRVPDNIIGSYAAYHKSKINNEYKTGKAFHIYRPWAKDATGEKVWCAFNKDWDGINDLEIHIPQLFLDNATYPIIIDPTIGYMVAGGTAVTYTPTSSTAVNQALALRAYTGFTGPWNRTYFYGNITGAGANTNVIGALYNETAFGATAAGTRIGYTNLLQLQPGLDSGSNAIVLTGWFQLTPLTNVTLPAAGSAVGYDQALFINIAANNPYNTFTIYRDTYLSGIGGIKSNVYQSPPPATAPSWTINTYCFSIYTVCNQGNAQSLMLGVG
jgi:hypothetical protein